MMRYAMALSAALALGAIPMAQAQDNQIRGTIQSVDPASRTVTLDNGQTVKLGSNADMTGLRPGGTIDETCSGSMMANCSLMQPDAKQGSPESQTAPSAGTGSKLNPPPSGTGSGTGSNGTSGGVGGSTGTGGNSSGSGSGSGSSN